MRFLFLIVSIGLFSCQNKGNTDFKNSDTLRFLPRNANAKTMDTMVITGAEQTQEYLKLIKEKTIAIVVNQTSVIGKTHLVDSLLSLGVKIKTIFAPEHGFRGDHSAGAKVNSATDEKTGLKITSLYGKNRKPSVEDLEGIDCVIFDIQDVGVRFYTYISTMHYVMEACAENNISFIVLDRPNPNGHYVDGPVLDIKFKSFIGMHPVPLVHGMTVGEFAQMINGEGWLTGGKKCQLTIIKLKDYTHQTMYKLPIRPSPNLPTMESVYLYPSVGLFEGTNVSVGRGTPKPFEWIGRPGLTTGSTTFTPKIIPGVVHDPPYEGKECRGILLTEFCNHYLIDSKQIYLEWLPLFYKSNIAEYGEFFKATSFDRLAGSDKLRIQIIEGKTSAQIRESWMVDLKGFEGIRKLYLLYPL
ncbi:MAG: exo-beta-N-acetylmuramidase NamZ domain-containing protein [Bacteroidia bacterium]